MRALGGVRCAWTDAARGDGGGDAWVRRGALRAESAARATERRAYDTVANLLLGAEAHAAVLTLSSNWGRLLIELARAKSGAPLTYRSVDVDDAYRQGYYVYP